jgi:type IV secretory pathway VirB2 component (pilin)
MKKNLFTLIPLSILLLLPVFIFAADDLIEPPDVYILGEGGVLDRIINYLFTILLVVAVIFILIAGFNFIFARGDTEKFLTARRALLYAVIGVFVAFAARGLVDFIGQVAGQTGP